MLTITAANQAFQVLGAYPVHVGTYSPGGRERAFLQYQHTKQFFMEILPKQGAWSAHFQRGMIIHSHESKQKVYFDYESRFELALLSGLHTFVFGDAPADRFTIHVPRDGESSHGQDPLPASLDKGQVVALTSETYRLEIEKEPDTPESLELKKQVFRRIQDASNPKDVDGHNLAIILGDLRTFLARQEGKGDVPLAQVFEFAYTFAKPKIIALLPVSPGFSRAAWPLGFDFEKAKIFFDSVTRTIRIVLDASHQEKPHVVEGFKRVETLFNEQMGRSSS